MPSLSSDLINQAKMLAKLETLRPKQSSLRRSISTAYYGLFHFLIEQSTNLIVGTGPDEEKNRQFVGRAFIHGKMKALCQEFVKSTPVDILQPFFRSASNPSKTSMAKIASTFIDLQDERHRADYDLSVNFSRIGALNVHQRAVDAVKEWETLVVADREFCRVFALSLSFWPSLSGRK
jgi:hypothetical protein